MLARILVLAALLGIASAECPNACSGHGDCGQNDMCTCYANWQGNDCGSRTCPSSVSFVTTPQGDLNMDGDRYDNTQKLLVKSVGGAANLGTILENDNVLTLNKDINAGELATNDAIRFDDATYIVTEVVVASQYKLDKPAANTVTGASVFKYLETTSAPKGTWESWAGDYSQGVDEGHYYMECSNQGSCDRKTGTCECFDGYTGSACQRQACSNNCNGHGICQSVSELSASQGKKLSITAYSGDQRVRDGASGLGGGSPYKAGSNNLVPSTDPTSEVSVGDQLRIGSLNGQTLTVTAITVSSISVEPATEKAHMFGSAVYLIPKYDLWDAGKGHTCVCDPGYTGNDCGLRSCPFGDDPLTTHFDASSTTGEALVEGGSTDYAQRNEKQNIYLDTARGSLSGSFTLTFTDAFGMAWTTGDIDVNGRLAGKAYVSSADTSTVTFHPSLPYGELETGDYLMVGDERAEVLTVYPASTSTDLRPVEAGGVIESVVVANGYTAASTNVYAFRAGPAKGIKAALEALPNGAVPSVTTENMMTGTLLGYPADGVVAATKGRSTTEWREIQSVSCVASGGAVTGTFTLGFLGQTTGNIDRDATAADIETALEALSTINDVKVKLEGGTSICDRSATDRGASAIITFIDPSGPQPALTVEANSAPSDIPVTIEARGTTALKGTTVTQVGLSSAPSSSLTLFRNINSHYDQQKQVSCTGTSTNTDLTCDLDIATDGSDVCPVGCDVTYAVGQSGPATGAPMGYNGGLAPYDMLRVKTASGKSEFLQVRNVDVYVDGALEMVAAKGKATATGSNAGYGTSGTTATPGIGPNMGGAMYRAGGYHVRVSFTSSANSGDIPEMEVDESGLYSVFVREFTGTVEEATPSKVIARTHDGDFVNAAEAYPFPSTYTGASSVGGGATHTFKGDIADLKPMAGMSIKLADQVRTIVTDITSSATDGAYFYVDAPFTSCDVSETVGGIDYIFYRYPVEQIYDEATYAQLTMSRAVFFPRSRAVVSSFNQQQVGDSSAVLSFSFSSPFTPGSTAASAAQASAFATVTEGNGGFSSEVGFAYTGADASKNYNLVTAYDSKGEFPAVFPVGTIMTCTGFTCNSTAECMNRIYAIEGYVNGGQAVRTGASTDCTTVAHAASPDAHANGCSSQSTKAAVGSAQSNQYHLKVAVLGTTDTTTACSDARDEVSAKCFRGGWASTNNVYSLTSTNHDASEAVCRFHDSMASLSSGTGSHGVAPPLHVNGRTISTAVTDQRPLVWATPDIDMTGLSRIGESLSRGDKRGVLGGGGATMTFLNDPVRLSLETGGKIKITTGDLLNVFGFDSDSTGTPTGTNVNFNVTLSGCSNAAHNKDYSITTVAAEELTAGTDDIPSTTGFTSTDGGICAGDTITLSTSLATLVDTNAIAVGDRFKVAKTSRHTHMENVYATCSHTDNQCTIKNAAGSAVGDLGHGFATGDTVTTGATLSGSGTGFLAGTEYSVVRISASKFSLVSFSAGVTGTAVSISTNTITTTFTKSKIRYETRTVDKIWKDANSGDVTMFSVADQFLQVRSLQNVEAWIDESGSTEQAECSNRGICDSEAGVCECFTGYTGNNCGIQSALAE